LTPVVVSSVTPRILARWRVNQPGLASMRLRIRAKSASSSSEVGVSISAVSPSSTRAPIRTYIVASPPSSRIMLAPSSKWKMRSM
jgi:hypothetical protein